MTVDFYIDVTYSLGVVILKTSSWFVKEVIRLDEYCLVIFTHYYDPSPTLWKVVANIMSSFLQYRHYQIGCMLIVVRSLLKS